MNLRLTVSNVSDVPLSKTAAELRSRDSIVSVGAAAGSLSRAIYTGHAAGAMMVKVLVTP